MSWKKNSNKYTKLFYNKKSFFMNKRKETEDKWKGIIGNIGLTGSQSTWMSQYNGLQSQSTTQSSFPSMMPIAMKVAAQTVGLDLVSVKPLSAPLGILPYMDYQYGNTKRTTRKRKINNIFKVNE
jgi:hypothetical protein